MATTIQETADMDTPNRCYTCNTTEDSAPAPHYEPVTIDGLPVIKFFCCPRCGYLPPCCNYARDDCHERTETGDTCSHCCECDDCGLTRWENEQGIS